LNSLSSEIATPDPMMALLAAIALITLTLLGVVRAEPMPQPKVGQCPSGYRESGGYCAPTSDRAPAAVPKVGQCPSGWVQSGAYCLDARRR
jgi:hypothetical protein